MVAVHPTVSSRSLISVRLLALYESYPPGLPENGFHIHEDVDTQCNLSAIEIMMMTHTAPISNACQVVIVMIAASSGTKYANIFTIAPRITFLSITLKPKLHTI